MLETRFKLSDIEGTSRESLRNDLYSTLRRVQPTSVVIPGNIYHIYTYKNIKEAINECIVFVLKDKGSYLSCIDVSEYNIVDKIRFFNTVYNIDKSYFDTADEIVFKGGKIYPSKRMTRVLTDNVLYTAFITMIPSPRYRNVSKDQGNIVKMIPESYWKNICAIEDVDEEYIR